MASAQLRQAAARRHGTFTTAEARSHGVTQKQLDRLIRDGVVQRMHRGIYGFAGVGPATFEQRAAAACLATDGIASHWTAARIWGLQRAPVVPLHVTIRPEGQSRQRDGLVVHRSARGLPWIFHDHIPATSAARTIVDLAALDAADDLLTELIGQVLASRIVTLSILERSLPRRGEHVTGLPRARELLRQVGGPVGSVLEAETVALLAGWGIPRPVLQLEIVCRGGQRYRADFAWPDHRLILETDGYRHHSSPEAFERDRVRQNDLVRSGWRVLRATARQLHERPDEVRQALLAALGAGPPSRAA